MNVPNLMQDFGFISSVGRVGLMSLGSMGVSRKNSKRDKSIQINPGCQHGPSAVLQGFFPGPGCARPERKREQAPALQTLRAVWPPLNLAKRMECVRLAGAFGKRRSRPA